ncbi:fungal-specific transcription factor domain-containing protein [Xylariales sp. PMI_506]|nr:fungal-specific transcription factor domain-containing protein [Xylariales sp. PMI_506]
MHSAPRSPSSAKGRDDHSDPILKSTTTHDGVGRRVNRSDRSCIVCHRRKVRCDKRSPCGNCTRTGILCCYPSDDRPTTRQPKTTIADIASRLVQLERTVLAIANDPQPPGEATSSSKRVTSSVDSDDVAMRDSLPDTRRAASKSLDEILVQGGDSSHYFNEILLSQVLKEEEEIRSVVAQTENLGDESYHSSTAATPRFGFLGMVPTENRQAVLNSSEDLFPSKRQAMELWQAFLKNVHPFTMVVHVPTAQIGVFAAMDNPEQASPATKSLVFSIYCAAATSMSPEDVIRILNQEKIQVLRRFTLGLERALSESDFLENPNITTLSALTLYLKTSRAHSPGRSMWILCGVAIRAAQSIGLHRDGSNFKLPPFHAEMRRRIWWHLMTRDWRAVEDHGITICDYDGQADTHIPLNVNDSDLDPSMTELPKPQSRWTEMTVSLIMIETSCAMQTVSKALLGFNLTRTPPREHIRREIFDDLKVRVGKLLEYCNPVVPAHRAAIMISRLIIQKHDFASRLQWATQATLAQQRQQNKQHQPYGNHSSASSSSLASSSTTPSEGRVGGTHATEQNLIDACEILELKTAMQEDEQLQGISWIGESYPQYHVVLYMLWHLCSKPSGPSAERAWRSIDTVFEMEAARILHQGGTSNTRWIALRALRDKALRKRGEAAVVREPRAGGVGGVSGGSSSSSGAAGAAVGIASAPVPAPAPLADSAPQMAGLGMENQNLLPGGSMWAGNMEWEGGELLNWNDLLEGINAGHYSIQDL